MHTFSFQNQILQSGDHRRTHVPDDVHPRYVHDLRSAVLAPYRLSQLGKEGRNCAEASSEILLASCSDTSDLRHNRRYHNRVRHFRGRRDRDHRLRYPQCSRFPEIFVVHRNVYRACAHDPVSESSVERDRKQKRSALAGRGHGCADRTAEHIQHLRFQNARRAHTAVACRIL